jgi:Peptidase family M1 domain
VPCQQPGLIIPARPIRKGARFHVTVSYVGRPGVHNDGDGSTEGWFRAPDGGFVTTEPVGSEAWMPLNDYPTAKPRYDFVNTVTAGRTVVANGQLVSVHHHGPSAAFAQGSATWRWHAAEPIASYLVEDSVGNYSLTRRTIGGITFSRAQDRSIPAAQREKNLKIMRMQQDITAFESRFTGPYPFPSDGVIIGTPPTSFEEEMETMIAFSGGAIDTGTLYHENMHQWWGDNVTEGGYRMTFFKEGMATVSEILYDARVAQEAAGGPGTAAGRAAFQKAIVRDFDQIYAAGDGFWTVAPSNPQSFGLFSGASTYLRPAIAYVALRQIIGHGRFTSALEHIQRRYGGATITEPRLDGRLPPVPAGEDERVPGAADAVLHPVVRHGVPVGRRPQPAVDHRAGPCRTRVLRDGWSLRAAGCGPAVAPGQRFSSISTNVAARPLALITLCSVPALPR